MKRMILALVFFALAMTVLPQEADALGEISPVSFMDSLAMNQISERPDQISKSSTREKGAAIQDPGCKEMHYIRNICETVENYFESPRFK